MIMPLVLLVHAVQVAEGAASSHGGRGSGRRRARDEYKRPGRNPDVDRYEEVYCIFRNSFLIALAPCAFVFLRSLLTDPAVPVALRVLWSRFVCGITDNLGSGGEERYHEAKRDRIGGVEEETVGGKPEA